MTNEALNATEQRFAEIQFELFPEASQFPSRAQLLPVDAGWSGQKPHGSTKRLAGRVGDSERKVRETPLIDRSESSARSQPCNSEVLHATASEAREVLKSTVSDVIARLQADSTACERMIISLVANAGIGKTETVCAKILCDALKSATPGRTPTVWFAVPNYRMVKQLVGTLRKVHKVSKRRIVILRGRDQNNMCRRADLIGRAGGLDPQIQNTFCDNGVQRCPFSIAQPPSSAKSRPRARALSISPSTAPRSA